MKYVELSIKYYIMDTLLDITANHQKNIFDEKYLKRRYLK